MKPFDWNKDKNEKLKSQRGICFDDIVISIKSGGLLDTISHPNIKRYPNQKQYVVFMNDYVYLVPFAEDDKKLFLKTIIPSRKATKKYISKK